VLPGWSEEAFSAWWDARVDRLLQGVLDAGACPPCGQDRGANRYGTAAGAAAAPLPGGQPAHGLPATQRELDGKDQRPQTVTYSLPTLRGTPREHANMSTAPARFWDLSTRACKFGYLSRGNATARQRPSAFALVRRPNAQISRRMLMQCLTTAPSSHLNRFPATPLQVRCGLVQNPSVDRCLSPQLAAILSVQLAPGSSAYCPDVREQPRTVTSAAPGQREPASQGTRGRDGTESSDRQPHRGRPNDPQAGGVLVPGDLSGGGDLGAARAAARSSRPGREAPLPARGCGGAVPERFQPEGAMTASRITITPAPAATHRLPGTASGDIRGGDHRHDRTAARHGQDSSSCSTTGTASSRAGPGG